VPCDARLLRIDQRVRILLQQIPAHGEHHLLAGGPLWIAMRAERGRRGPRVERRDILRALRDARRALTRRLREDAADIPELTEVAAAPVGRILPPEQLLAELVVEPGEV